MLTHYLWYSGRGTEQLFSIFIHIFLNADLSIYICFLRIKFMPTCKVKNFDKLLEVNWFTKSVKSLNKGH